MMIIIIITDVFCKTLCIL